MNSRLIKRVLVQKPKTRFKKKQNKTKQLFKVISSRYVAKTSQIKLETYHCLIPHRLKKLIPGSFRSHFLPKTPKEELCQNDFAQF